MAMYEREPAREVRIDNATARFYHGLEVLSRLPGLAANFGWCLGQLADEPDFAEQFRGMVEFYDAYRQLGLEEALGAIDTTSGIPLTVAAGGRGAFPGRVVGLLGPHEDNSHRFVGVASAELDSSGEQFMIVDISLDDPGVAIITEVQRQ